MRVNGLVHLLNGSYSVYEVRLSEAQIQEHGLGTAWSLSRSRAAVVGAF